MAIQEFAIMEITYKCISLEDPKQLNIIYMICGPESAEQVRNLRHGEFVCVKGEGRLLAFSSFP